MSDTEQPKPCVIIGSYSVEKLRKRETIELSNATLIAADDLWNGEDPYTRTERRLRDLLTAGQKMRDSQKLYFKTRDRGVMMQCKELEKKFDLALAEAKREIGETGT